VPAEGGQKGRDSAKDSGIVQSVRVHVDLLENLMTMVSELVLSRNQLLQMVRKFEDSEFAGPLQRLSLITTDLQEGVMKTRMQAIGNAWSKLPRIVRDLSVELGKKIDLEMIGAETELDRQVLEMIKDPLTHMVRNSGDHGIELPAERLAAGKPETGRIVLNAYHEGGHIIIRISDDGRGINIERVRQKAVANGLAPAAELAEMSDQQIMQFIFKPGFSTAEKVTNVSGRGVGMDVVRTNIERIGGHVERAVRRRALRHPADQRQRAGPRLARLRAPHRAYQRHPRAPPARPAAAAGGARRDARAARGARHRRGSGREGDLHRGRPRRHL
jgi:two-component system chemotaxis sensor kinase CheA